MVTNSSYEQLIEYVNICCHSILTCECLMNAISCIVI